MVMSGDLSLFLNWHAALVILGGSLAATLIRFPLSTMLSGLPMGLRYVVQLRSHHPRELVEDISRLSLLARKEGLVALRRENIPHPFLKKGVDYLVDGHDVVTIQSYLLREKENFLTRLDEGQSIYRSIGDCAPAFGLVGTLIGMVQMFANMQDPTSLGPFMATALLATLYGALIANLIALPIADKLQGKLQDEELLHSLIIEGVLAMKEAKNPRLLQETLLTFLPEHQRGVKVREPTL
jgi:chemotaxis protein MotA